MRGIRLAVIVLAAVSAGAANAEHAPDWARRIEALTQALARSLTGGRAPDREIIKPPGHIDPKMALAPRQNQGTMRVIVPPGPPGRW